MNFDPIRPKPDGSHRILAEYDSDTLGPLFAVSDEGSAGLTIVGAAYDSAKARALAPVDAFTLGMILDGERMTSAGEVPIGPPEYAALSAAAAGRLLLTTNVGVRVNARLLKQLPEFPVTDTAPTAAWCDEVCDAFRPFLDTPDHRPRPLTVRLALGSSVSADSLKPAAEKLERRREQGKIGPTELHRIAALVVFDGKINTEAQFQRIEAVMTAAKEAGLVEVAVDGDLREGSRKRLGDESLLNVLEVEPVRRLLARAGELGLRLEYRYQLDAESAARTIWTGLEAARNNGFTAGKYGLFPLPLEEQAIVMELVSKWTGGWTAIPAFYVDTWLMTATDVYDEGRCIEGARKWIRAARGSGATVALFDCPDRVTPRRLLKTGIPNDQGILTVDQVEELAAYGKGLGLSILWSGGITSGQAYELARRKVFGLFSTSSTAAKIAVTARFASDPRLPAENEPTEFGVRRMHAIVQAGFLSAELGDRDPTLSQKISSSALRLLKSEGNAADSEGELTQLDSELFDGWKVVRTTAERVLIGTPDRSSHPVPPDSVRVFRGRRKRGLTREGFVEKLGGLFMPLTVQMQRIFGLSAYLPAVLPPHKSNGLPDEVALVFYRSQDAYREAKQCVGGRAYSEAHELVFDMPASPSEFPNLFSGQIEADRAYYLLERSVDWQLGASRLHVGTRRKVTTDKFLADVRTLAAQLQDSPQGRDAVIFCADADWLVWWEHAPRAADLTTDFDGLTEPVFDSYPRRLRVPDSLTEPYLGLTLEPDGEFVNFQFERL